MIITMNKANVGQIADHLNICSDQFSPPLDERVEITSYAEKIANSAYRFEAWNDRELIGLLAIYCNDPKCYMSFITSVSVYPKWQGKGVSSRLMERSICYVRSLGFHRISLEVDRGNRVAQGLYEKYGFVKYDEYRNTMIMQLDIEENEDESTTRL